MRAGRGGDIFEGLSCFLARGEAAAVDLRTDANDRGFLALPSCLRSVFILRCRFKMSACIRSSNVIGFLPSGVTAGRTRLGDEAGTLPDEVE